MLMHVSYILRLAYMRRTSPPSPQCASSLFCNLVLLAMVHNHEADDNGSYKRIITITKATMFAENRLLVSSGMRLPSSGSSAGEAWAYPRFP